MMQVLYWFAGIGIAAPLMCGVPTAITQSAIVADRKSRTGQGWGARDTFEVQDSVLSAAAFLFPIGATLAFLDAKLDMPSWQWWGVLIAIAVLGTLAMQLQSRWSIARRASFGSSGAQPKSENTSASE